MPHQSTLRKYVFKKAVLPVAALFLGMAAAAQTPFTCSNLAYQTTSVTAQSNSFLNSYNVGSGLRTQIGAQLPMNVNALGYNMVDNMLWAYDITNFNTAWPNGPARLVRIDATGATTGFPIANLPMVAYNSGTISPDGYMYLYQTGNGRIYVVDLNPARTATYLKMVEPANKTVVDAAPFGVALVPPAGIAFISVSDYAYVPGTGMLLSVINAGQPAAHQAVTINPVTGAVTLGPVPAGTDFANDNSGMGGVFYDANNNFYGFTNPQGFFYRVDGITTANPVAVKIAQNGDAFVGLDGASCTGAVLVTTITGNVFNDLNGLSDATVNGTGVNPGGLYAVLYDATTNQVADTSLVLADGTYSFNAMPGENYRVVLTTSPPVIGATTQPAPALPSGWVFTGDNLGAGAGNDGTANGLLAIGVLPNAGLTNANFGVTQPVTVSGTLFNDNNGTTGGANGTPMPAGTTVTLYAANGTTVIATTTTDASGNYSFPNLLPGNYVIGVTPPAGYSNVSSTDATPTNGQTSVTVSGTAVPGVNFGLNQPPAATADLLANQAPGSPATVPNILANDTDPNSGTLSPDSITLVAPPGATGITTDAQGDVTGFTVPGQGTWALNSSTGAVTFTPVAGFTGDPTPISYTVTDGAGLNSTPTTITIDYNPPVTVSGTLFNDNNGTTGGANGTPMPAGTTVTLYAANGTTVIATTTTDASGNYSFPNTVPGNYVIGVTPPAGYQNVSSTDATPTNGQTSVAVGSTAVPGVNFGLNQPPAATADLLANQAPGSPATVPNVLANDTDPNSGTLSPDSITLVAPPGATGITTDAQGDVTGFTVPGQGTWALNSSTGAVTFTPVAGFTGDPTPISYTVTDGAGLNSTPTTITIDYNPPVTVSGTLFNDNNGTTGGANGTPMPAGTTVTLYAANGTTVIATTTTDASGNYSFPNTVPGNYVIGVTPPAGYQNVSSTDATPTNGQTSVAIGSTAVPGVNFGLNQPPAATADLLANQAPGSPATVPNVLANDTDPNSGTLSPDSITLVAPPGATGITTDAQGDVTGFTIPGQGTWALNSSTGAVTFTPVAGFTGDPTPISYTVTDGAGLNSTPTTITIDYNPPVTVSGTVYNDNNAGTPDGTPYTGATVTLFAADGTTVIATTTTDASGNYSFPNVIPGNYQVQVTPPAGFQNVSSTDGTPLTPTPVTIGSSPVSGTSFGINQPPQATNNTTSSSNPPAGAVSVPVAPSGFGGTDANGGSIDSLRITGFPTNSTSITIGGTTYYPDPGSIPSGCTTCAVFPGGGVTVPTTADGQPTVAISVDPSGTTATTVTIPYTVTDNAHLQDPTPGVLTLPFGNPLPVEWLYFTATAAGRDVVLNWATATEQNTDYFEAEYATDGSHFRKLGQVAAAGNSTATSSYSLKHNNATDLGVPVIQYRIRQADRDGRYTYSEVRSVQLKAMAGKGITLYPNPVLQGSDLNIAAAQINEVVVFNAAGSKVWTQRYDGVSVVTLSTRTFRIGTYFARINDDQVVRFIVK